MANAQATLAEAAEKVMQTMIIENETISVKDLRDLRLMKKWKLFHSLLKPLLSHGFRLNHG